MKMFMVQISMIAFTSKCLTEILLHTARPVNGATEGSTQVACMCASCVLPKKVAFLVWVPNSALIGNDGCYLCASCMLPSTLLLQEQAWLIHSRNSPIIFFKAILDWNSHLLAYFSRKHAGSTHACYLRASFCCTINGSCCRLKRLDKIRHT